MLEQNNCLCFSVSEKSFGKKDIIKKNNKGEKLINTSLAAKGVLAYRLQRRTACNAAPPAKSKMAARGPQNGRPGLERCLHLGFWAF